MGHTVMNPLLTLLEVYKNHVMLFFKHHTITLPVDVEYHAINFSPSLQSTVVYMILKFVVDFVDGQAVFLDAKETSALVNFCLRLLQIYSSHNIGKVRNISTSILFFFLNVTDDSDYCYSKKMMSAIVVTS